VHCPPKANHAIVGAGSGPCAALAMSSREQLAENCGGGAYTANEAARHHDASVDSDTSDSSIAYAHVPTTEPARYRDGLLPTP
jgi:hypothetical protein